MKKALILLICCLLLTACTQQDPIPAGQGNNPGENSSIPSDTTETAADPDTEQTTTEPENYSIYIYIPNENLDGFTEEGRLIEQMNEDAIIKALIDANILTEGVSVNSLTQEGSTLRIDMNEAFRDLICSQGTTGELMVMGSLVNTFLSAYGAEAVELTINGEILESGHVIYDFPMGFFQS